MADPHTLTFEMTPEDAVDRAMSPEGDTEAALVVAMLYQGLLNTLDHILDQYEGDNDGAIEQIEYLLRTLQPEPVLLN